MTNLPKREVEPFVCSSFQYGAGYWASVYCGLKKTPQQMNGRWSHAWGSPHILTDPRLACGESDFNISKDKIWIGNSSEEKYLKIHGYKAKAIGLPICYLPPQIYKRLPGSLLIMPAHSLDYTSHDWKFKEYAKQIKLIMEDFSRVAVCLHSSCIKKGYWVKEFEEIGVPIIEGAHASDRNSLLRTRALMSQFEFVTTNGYGSHIAYGAAFGAKVSFYGDICEFSSADYVNCRFYEDIPGLAETVVPLFSEKVLLKHFDKMFCHPREAEERVEWGLEQIGYNNRISPSEMRRCFGWEWYHEPLRKAKTYFHIGANKLLTRKMRIALDEWGHPPLKARNSELRRIESLPEGQSGRAALEGLSLHFNEPQSFLREYRRIFLDKALDVPCIKGSPSIVDWGAGIGLTMRYWANKFPTPEIHLFEPHDEMREALAKNAAEATNAKVQIHENSRELAELLDRPVDFLRIDLGMLGMELLEGVGDRIRAAERILVTCRTELGKEQQVSKVLRLLENHGFRYHLLPRNASANPLVDLKCQQGADCVVDVWGYRGDMFPRTV